MANAGVTGKVCDQTQAGVSGVLVGAYDLDGLFGERLLEDTGAASDPVFPGYVRTRADGTFSISYASGSYQLQVRAFSKAKRFLGASTPVAATTPAVALAAPIVVASDTGWVARGGAFTPVGGSIVTYLVDNKECWDLLITAVDGATTSINWMLFYLDIGKSMMRFDADPPAPTAPVSGRRLEGALDSAADRGVTVRLVCNELVAGAGGIIKVPYPASTAARVEAWFAQSTPPKVEVRRFATPAYIPIHTKFVVIDNQQAFILGSPFVQDYYDSSRHAIDDPRHGDFLDLPSWLPCESHQIRQPTHDVNVTITGTAIGALNETFALHWNLAKPAGAADLAPDPAPAAAANATGSVQITRSLSGNSRFAAFPSGETSILESYQRAIENATDFIYLENQYFTCLEIADALVAALKGHLKVQVILLTNNAVDIPGYAKWQPETIRRIRDRLSPDEFRRFGVFTLWSHEEGGAQGGPQRICRNYVHSKVAVIDDEWATVGSANLDGDSLVYSQNATRGGYRFAGDLLSLRQAGLRTDNRESETNIVVYNNVGGLPASTFPAELRRRLWAEHLGYLANGEPDPNAADLLTKPTAPDAPGWLGLWRTRAHAKRDQLAAEPPVVHPARVLPYPANEDPDTEWPTLSDNPNEKFSDAKFYLETLGANPKVKLVPHYRRFNWDAGTWVKSDE